MNGDEPNLKYITSHLELKFEHNLPHNLHHGSAGGIVDSDSLSLGLALRLSINSP